MKKIALLTALLAVTTVVSAQEQGRVLSATPVVQQVGIPQQVCGNETVYNGSHNSGAGALLGAIAGGAAGNAVGHGSGRAAATALGVIGGAVLGNHIEGQGRPQYENVQRCGTETYYENRTVGYNVVYEYAGRQYSTQTATDPGRYITVQVQPTSQPAPYGQSGYVQPGVVSSPYTSYPQPGVTVIEYGYENDPYRPRHPHYPPHNHYNNNPYDR